MNNRKGWNPRGGAFLRLENSESEKTENTITWLPTSEAEDNELKQAPQLKGGSQAPATRTPTSTTGHVVCVA